MQKGLERFEYFLKELETLLTQASRQKNPALYLYRQPTRTHLFMLEGLCRCYGSMHNSKRFDRLRHEFKLLEDALGAIDYYDDIAKKTKDVVKIPAAVKQYMQAMTREKIQHFNDLLEQGQWIGHRPKKLKKIREKLETADRNDEREEMEGIRNYYLRSIGSIHEFLKKSGPDFNDMEHDVHEFRRKIRWLSIYPHALRGAIQFGKTGKVRAHLKKYMTPETRESRFNVFPGPGENRYLLLLDKTSFLSLSWLIAELGRLKDSGLMVVGIQEALNQGASSGDEAYALKKTYDMLGKNQVPLPVLLKKSAEICHRFSEEQVLDSLVQGVEKSEKKKMAVK